MPTWDVHFDCRLNTQDYEIVSMFREGSRTSRSDPSESRYRQACRGTSIASISCVQSGELLASRELSEAKRKWTKSSPLRPKNTFYLRRASALNKRQGMLMTS